MSPIHGLDNVKYSRQPFLSFVLLHCQLFELIKRWEGIKVCKCRGFSHHFWLTFIVPPYYHHFLITDSRLYKTIFTYCYFNVKVGMNAGYSSPKAFCRCGYIILIFLNLATSHLLDILYRKSVPYRANPKKWRQIFKYFSQVFEWSFLTLISFTAYYFDPHTICIDQRNVLMKPLLPSLHSSFIFIILIAIKVKEGLWIGMMFNQAKAGNGIDAACDQ